MAFKAIDISGQKFGKLTAIRNTHNQTKEFTMNKQELVDAIASASGLTKTVSSQSLEAFIDVVSTTLKSGDEVRITNFGTFCATKRAATKGRNPQTGETITDRFV